MKIFVASLLVGSIFAEFTPDFSTFLASYYGPQVRDQMERRDLASKGSFGGKADRSQLLENQPIVFVHGVSDTAGEKMRQAANWFRSMGYKKNELYSTTYSNGAQGNPLKWVEYGMRCEYVKQVRALIVATRLYTGRAVDVIAFSLGVPVSRKAILGGRCVDSGEYLGGPLTKYIDTFVGVAGPNHGITLQVGGVAIPGCVLSIIPVCNQVTGLYSGLCPSESEFLQDINRQAGYEGQHIFSIYSKKDQVVGHIVCGKVTSQIAGQMGEKVFENLNHDETFHNTHSVQLAMIRNHILV
ncbi:Triacylglycerol lipase [Trichostrongylus colubriformis]|uniref:Triacylglycerol lipase n=1 Tax=Trichostrongylus colubriformis TaxID=6319 RepID=A0AAN8IMK3_TRICO